VPSGSFRAEFTALAIRASFLKNGTTTKARISRLEGALDFQYRMALDEGYYLYCTKNSLVSLNGCGKIDSLKIVKY